MNCKNLISLKDLSIEETWKILKTTEILKLQWKSGYREPLLKGKTLGMIFQKSSTRTRVSFEIAMLQLGGHALFLSSNDLQLGRGETISDTAKVLSRYVDGIMARVYKHEDIITLAENATVPVINGLSDFSHPCQGLTDFFTIYEKKGSFKNLKMVYIGDGNNVAHSLMFGAVKLGVKLVVCTPEGFEPSKKVMEFINQENPNHIVTLSNNLEESVKGADVIYTDVWVSMGQEDQKEKVNSFKDYQVNSKIVKLANPDFIFMHCLPAHRGEEVTNEVIDSNNSIVFDQAENRLHTQKAILTLLMN